MTRRGFIQKLFGLIGLAPFLPAMFKHDKVGTSQIDLPDPGLFYEGGFAEWTASDIHILNGSGKYVKTVVYGKEITE